MGAALSAPFHRRCPLPGECILDVTPYKTAVNIQKMPLSSLLLDVNPHKAAANIQKTPLSPLLLDIIPHKAAANIQKTPLSSLLLDIIPHKAAANIQNILIYTDYLDIIAIFRTMTDNLSQMKPIIWTLRPLWRQLCPKHKIPSPMKNRQ